MSCVFCQSQWGLRLSHEWYQLLDLCPFLSWNDQGQVREHLQLGEGGGWEAPAVQGD